MFGFQACRKIIGVIQGPPPPLTTQSGSLPALLSNITQLTKEHSFLKISRLRLFNRLISVART